MMHGLEDLVGLELISSDAWVVGSVEGAILDLSDWRVKALKVGLRHGTESAIGRRKRRFALDRILIGTEGLGSVSDVIMMQRPIAELSEQIRTKDSKLTPVGAFLGMRVMSADAVYLGNVDNILVEPSDDWAIRFIKVKLARYAKVRLEKRHGLKVVPLLDIRTTDVKASGDMVILSLSYEQVRANLIKDSSSLLKTGVTNSTSEK